MDVATIERAVREALAERGERPAAVYLYGSRARGDARDDSDVDLGVLFGAEAPTGYAGLKLGLAGAIERRLGKEVDLVVLDRAPADLVHRVLRDGALLIEDDRAARVAFEVYKRNEYFDLLPMLRRIRNPGGAA